MLTYRGDKFVKGKKFKINENEYRFSKRDEDKLIFESVSDGSRYELTESEFDEAERVLTEKINQENKEINDIIGKVLRSKGLARKYEDQLKSKGITVNYDSPQGVTLTGPNGKVLGASSKEVYGPHTPDSSSDKYDKNGYRRNADGHYTTSSKPDNFYSKQVELEKAELEKLESMDRDDIIRKYNDKTTEEALKAHQELVDRTRSRIAEYTKDTKREDKRYQSDLKNAKRERRNAQYDRLRTSTPKDSADETIDYLNYLTKPKNDYMDSIRSYYKGYGERSKSNPAAGYENKDAKSDIDKYKSLKQQVNSARDDVDERTAGSNSRFKYSSAAMTDEELEAKIQSMRDELEQKIEDLRNSNKANSESRDNYIKRLQDKEKELDDFLKAKGIRESDLIEIKNYLKESSSDDYRELYGDTADYTDLRRIVEALRVITERADEDGYVYMGRLEQAIDLLSRTVEDLEEFYENK